MSGQRLNTWMPFYFADYRADTSHLSAIQHGAYFLLIGHYWITGKPLPADDAQLARIAAMTGAEWRKHSETIMAFFQLVGDAWHHGRIDRELAHAKAVSDARREAGQRGGRPKQTPEQNESKEEPIAKPIANQMGKQNETQLQPPSQKKEIKASASLVTASVANAAPGRSPEPPPSTPEPEANLPPFLDRQLATGIIRAFDESRAQVFGPNRARPWPGPKDLGIAQRWLATGADLDLCRHVFDSQNAKLKDRGRQPMDHLAGFDRDVTEAIEARKSAPPGRQRLDNGMC